MNAQGDVSRTLGGKEWILHGRQTDSNGLAGQQRNGEAVERQGSGVPWHRVMVLIAQRLCLLFARAAVDAGLHLGDAKQARFNLEGREHHRRACGNGDSMRTSEPLPSVKKLTKERNRNIVLTFSRCTSTKRVQLAALQHKMPIGTMAEVPTRFLGLVVRVMNESRVYLTDHQKHAQRTLGDDRSGIHRHGQDANCERVFRVGMRNKEIASYEAICAVPPHSSICNNVRGLAPLSGVPPSTRHDQGTGQAAALSLDQTSAIVLHSQALSTDYIGGLRFVQMHDPTADPPLAPLPPAPALDPPLMPLPPCILLPRGTPLTDGGRIRRYLACHHGHFEWTMALTIARCPGSRRANEKGKGTVRNSRDYYNTNIDQPRHKKAEDAVELRDRERRAAKRREASRRYYAAHPEVREKNRIKIAERRLAAKMYRRQWDPPKMPVRDRSSERDLSDGDELSSPSVHDQAKALSADERSSWSVDMTEPPTEEIAHAALTAMYQKTAATPTREPRVPLSLAAIEGYESSESGKIGHSALTRDWEDERVALALRLQEEAMSRHQNVEDARLEREKAARMRIHVETGPAPEALYEYRGSAGVASWLEGL
ncbi:hypothetical protein DFH06DRAFT_1123277 [Mycena polygramma]|nr:hypothetical protein DFH06DRAFT_1123277 [Mycena polygramma]